MIRKSCKQNSNTFALNETENIYIQWAVLKLAVSQTCREIIGDAQRNIGL